MLSFTISYTNTNEHKGQADQKKTKKQKTGSPLSPLDRSPNPKISKEASD